MKSPRLIEWYIAYRFLKEGRTQSLLIFLGAAVGVAVIVFLTALIGGLQDSLIETTLGSQAHIVIEPLEEETLEIYTASAGEVVFSRMEPRSQRERSLNRWQQLRDEIETTPGIRDIAPVATGPGFAIRGAARKAIRLIGIEPESYAGIVDIEDRLIAGDFRLSDSSVVLGKTLAENLGVDINDRIRLANAAGDSRTFSVRGIVDVGSEAANEAWALISLRDGQSFLDLRGGVSRLEVTVFEIFEAERIAARLQENHPLMATSWQEANRDLLTGLRSQSASSTMITVFVVIAVALGIASVLVVSVVQRQGQIGVLRAMGAPISSVVKVFLIQGAMVGLVGSLIGTLLGWLLVQFFVTFARGPEGDALFPIELTATLILGACLLATITGLIAAVAPARSAATLDPSEAITNG